MRRLTEKGDCLTIGSWVRCWTGRINQVRQKNYVVSEYTRWNKYSADSVFELIFVGDILRIRELDDKTSRGLLVELENQDDVDFYLNLGNGFDIIEIMTLDHSMAIDDYKVHWRSSEFVSERYIDVENSTKEELDENSRRDVKRAELYKDRGVEVV